MKVINLESLENNVTVVVRTAYCTVVLYYFFTIIIIIRWSGIKKKVK